MDADAQEHVVRCECTCIALYAPSCKYNIIWCGEGLRLVRRLELELSVQVQPENLSIHVGEVMPTAPHIDLNNITANTPMRTSAPPFDSLMSGDFLSTQAALLLASLLPRHDL